MIETKTMAYFDKAVTTNLKIYDIVVENYARSK